MIKGHGTCIFRSLSDIHDPVAFSNSLVILDVDAVRCLHMSTMKRPGTALDQGRLKHEK